MATLIGDNRTKALDPTSDNVLAKGTLGGRVRVMSERITFAADALTDTVELFRNLRAGSRILGLEIHNAALGAGTTLDIGDSDTADRYTAAPIAMDTAASENGPLPTAALNYVVGTNVGDDLIVATLVAGAVWTGQLDVNLYYTED